MILLNPVVISVILLTILCLLKFNVLVSIIISAIVAGVLGGIPLFAADGYHVISVLTNGMGGNAATALSYILLGAFAVGLGRSHLGEILSRKLSRVLEGKKLFMVFSLAFISIFSQNLIPIHIAFIPILIPPLLGLMNKLKIDRRAISIALAFGLKAPYITIPVGFGLIFHQVLVDNISANGIDVTIADTSSVMWIGGLSMLVGLIIMGIYYGLKNREYEDKPIIGREEDQELSEIKMTKESWGALIAAAVTAIVSIYTQSLPLSALAGLLTMLVTGCIKFNELDLVVNGGIRMMGFIAFIMLVASGYANVLTETGAIEDLVNQASAYMQGSQAMAAFLMLLIGLVITIGIGTSFGTIPIIAAIYVPLGLELGLSVESIILLIGIAGALGDAGSPASDSTLGPTSGLNADGQHDHIWDTVVPTFISFNIPLIIGGVIGVMILG